MNVGSWCQSLLAKPKSWPDFILERNSVLTAPDSNILISNRYQLSQPSSSRTQCLLQGSLGSWKFLTQLRGKVLSPDHSKTSTSSFFSLTTVGLQLAKCHSEQGLSHSEKAPLCSSILESSCEWTTLNRPFSQSNQSIARVQLTSQRFGLKVVGLQVFGLQQSTEYTAHPKGLCLSLRLSRVCYYQQTTTEQTVSSSPPTSKTTSHKVQIARRNSRADVEFNNCLRSLLTTYRRWFHLTVQRQDNSCPPVLAYLVRYSQVCPFLYFCFIAPSPKSIHCKYEL